MIEWNAWAFMRLVRDADLPAVAKHLAMTLCTYANDEGECWPRQEVLCSATGLSERAIRNHTRHLEAGGYIERLRRCRKSALYRLILYPAPHAGDKRHHVPVNVSIKNYPLELSQTDKISAVYEAWKVYHPRSPGMSDKQKGNINARLKEGWTVDQLCKVVDWAHHDDFMRRGGWLMISNLMRGGDKMQRKLDKANQWEASKAGELAWLELVQLDQWRRPNRFDFPRRDHGQGDGFDLAADPDEHDRRVLALDNVGGWGSYVACTDTKAFQVAWVSAYQEAA